MSARPSTALRAIPAAAMLAAGTCLPAGAGPDVGRGRLIAAQLCSQCHMVGREQNAGGFVGPSFVGIANMPSTTGLALSVFLQSHHLRMPSLRLERDERDAVIDYILSLKAAPRATP